MNAGSRWAEGLQALAIPDAILAAAPEPRRGPDPAVFRLRTEAALRAPLSASHRRALDALPKDGSVLDVGVGAGAASLPLASRAYLIVGVDRSETMKVFRSRIFSRLLADRCNFYGFEVCNWTAGSRLKGGCGQNCPPHGSALQYRAPRQTLQVRLQIPAQYVSHFFRIGNGGACVSQRHRA